MHSETITLRAELPGSEPPSEFRIFPSGAVETTKGTFVFDAQSAQLVMDAYAGHATDLSIDYEHAALEEAGEISHGAPAAAWFKLQVREDGLWAVELRWTPRAIEYLSNREYRYYSPAFVAEPQTKRIVKLVNIALTNLPATRGLTPLVAARGAPEVEPMKMLLDACMSLTGKSNPSEALGVITAWKGAAQDMQAMAERIRVFEAEQLTRTVTNTVDDAMKGTHPKVTPASRQMFIDLGLQHGMPALIASLNALTPLAFVTPILPPAGALTLLTEHDTRYAEQLGLDPKDVAATKARMNAGQ